MTTTSFSVARAWQQTRTAARWLRRHPIILAGLILLGIMVLIAIASPLFATHDPIRLNPTQRLKPPSAEHWFGTDQLGRDVYSRVIYGSQIAESLSQSELTSTLRRFSAAYAANNRPF